ncbi:hypothetical protein G5575_12425 [Devosia chinhatensis]|uniref:Translocation and assembly module TamB C-terminal domain-containing protein n=2 Tax=Devosia aurantiaca TaxID=2714858 RepID=A0A6M1SNV2_9HYPH|nr:hypothetical protein [Devosia aurantiaca]
MASARKSLAGSLALEGGNLDAALDIVRLDGPGGTLDLDVAFSNETQIFDLGLSLVEPPNGVIANLLNIEGRPAVQLTLDGQGPVSDLEAQLRLLANDQEALAGTASIAQQPGGYGVSVDLGGPLSTLVAEQYRPFFGADTRLAAEAMVLDVGGVEISSLTLNGGQLDLSASASTTADNFLSRLDLSAAIVDPNGGRVTLPAPGLNTVQSAQLQIRFGTDASDQWSSTLAIDDFETAGFAADTLALNIGGVAQNLQDAATRMVTFNGDGTLAGISADEGVEAALGDSVGLGIAGVFNAGQPIELAQLRIVGEALTAGLAGTIDGTDFDGRIEIETDNIAPFSLLAGRDLTGALSLAATGQIMPLTGGFNLDFDGTGTDLTVDDATADALLEGTVTLSGRLARTTAGISADDFVISNEQVQFTADGAFASDVADFAIALDLADLALLSDQASGALSVRGSARSTAPDAPLELVLDAEVPSGSLAVYTLRDAQIGVAANLLDGDISGDVTGVAMLDGNRATLDTHIETDDLQQALSGISFEIAGTRLTGAVSRAVDTGLLDGRLEVTSSDVSLAAAMLLTDAAGAIDAAVTLTPEGETQAASITADATNLRVNDITVGRADVTAAIADLFGVPAIDGTATASNVSAGGVDIQTLAATASQSGDTTNFDARARLATGTDVDLAGALSPVEGGYRLALNRADLVQGQLSARLANPTALVVGGDSVSLDAIRFNVGSGSVTATGTAGEQLNIVVDIAQLPLSIANAVSPDLGLAGTVNGRATISGAASAPQVRFEAQANGVSASAISSFGIAPLSLSAAGGYANGAVSLDSISAQGIGGLSVSGSGRVPLDGGPLAVSLNGSAPLALANRFVFDRGGVFSGTASFDANISGSLSDPQFAGAVSTSGAGYVDPELNLRLTDIDGRVSLNGSTATVETLRANLATGGSISAQGTVGLSDGLPANLQVNINSARYADGEIFVATLSGALNLTGPITGSPLLSGQVLIEEANVAVPEGFGGGAPLIEVEHVRTPRPVQETLNRARINARTGSTGGGSSSQLQLDLTINAPNQIFVRGRGLDAEVGGQVRLTGTISNIQPVGAFSLLRGRLDVLGQRLDFETGTVTLWATSIRSFISWRAPRATASPFS